MANRKTVSVFFLLSFFFLLTFVFCFTTNARSIKVLFIGNSYTYVNNLPQLISGLATSTGDQLLFSSSTPGGYTFQQHSADPATLGLIAQGGWDFVVLQEQSQRPAFPDGQVEDEVYPYARKLDSLVKVASPCARTVFYMTWGRKNGDASNCPYFPPLCTYTGMDSLLQLRYMIMADSNNAVVSPVAKVWRQLRASHPSLELYDADESHPSPRGSYAAACAFYTIFYQKNPALCSYNATLPGVDAAIIRNAAKQIVYDSLATWYQYDPLPAAQFTYTISGSQVSFQNNSSGATTHKWYFGDGDSSTLASPVHTYATNGTYTVKFIAGDCGITDTSTVTIQMTTTGITELRSKNHIELYPNPATSQFTVQAEDKIRSVTLVSQTGQILVSLPAVNATKVNIATSGLPDGIYYIHIQTDSASVQSCILKR